MGRPPVEIDMVQLEALLRMKPTLADVAAFFKCSEDTIERRIKAHTATDESPDGCTFAEFRDQSMVHTRFDLIRSAIAKSEKSDVMHIFCLKNLCGWRDKQPGEEPTPIQNNNLINVTDEQLNTLVLTAKGVSK